MSNQAVPLKGKVFGRLHVLRRAKKGVQKAGNARWLCLCSCGNTVTVSSNHLLDRHTQSCGCLFREIVKAGTNKRHGMYGTKEYEIYNHAKQRASKLGFPFDITVEDVKTAWPLDGICPVMRIPLHAPTKRPGPASPTLDRIIPEKGYVKGNIAIISFQANTMKSNCTDPAVFRHLADWLEEQFGREVTPKGETS